MPQSVVGKWGKNLAIRIPMEVARAAGLTEGEKAEVEAQDGDIVVRRQEARDRSRQDAEPAAEEIIAEAAAIPSVASQLARCWKTGGESDACPRRVDSHGMAIRPRANRGRARRDAPSCCRRSYRPLPLAVGGRQSAAQRRAARALR